MDNWRTFVESVGLASIDVARSRNMLRDGMVGGDLVLALGVKGKFEGTSTMGLVYRGRSGVEDLKNRGTWEWRNLFIWGIKF